MQLPALHLKWMMRVLRSVAILYERTVSPRYLPVPVANFSKFSRCIRPARSEVLENVTILPSIWEVLGQCCLVLSSTAHRRPMQLKIRVVYRIFAHRTNTSQNTNVKDPFFLDTFLGILINTFRETYNRFSWTIRFTYRPSRWLNGLRESIHTWRPTGFIVVRESGHYGILPRSVINGINRSVRDVITSPSVWRSYRE